MKVRTRFAPSPTGFMHIGNLRTALYAFLFARHNDGTFILRIEDTDQERYVEGAVDIIYNTLKETGISHDEGPDKDGEYGPYIQSERKGMYLGYAQKLVELGGAYYCFCTKERLDSLADDKNIKKYDKHCLSLSKAEIEQRLAAGEPYVIRQNIPEKGISSYHDLVYGDISVDYDDLDDGVLIKSDGMPTYNFANVIDDHLMAISHILRGSEYLSSTPKYNLMYDAFGWDRPAYIHLPLILRDAQHKLSKRHGDANYDDFIKKGYLPQAIINYIALLGWSPKDNREKLSMSELIELFSVDGINKSGSIFDEPKMRWLNSQYVKELPLDEFHKLALPYYEQSKAAGKYDYTKLSELLHTRTEIFSDIPSLINFLEEFGEFSNELYFNKRQKTDAETAKDILPKAFKLIESLDEKSWSNAELYEELKTFSENEGLKIGQLLWPLRIAITGKENTPGGASEMMALLGKTETLRRLNFSIARL